METKTRTEAKTTRMKIKTMTQCQIDLRAFFMSVLLDVTVELVVAFPAVLQSLTTSDPICEHLEELLQPIDTGLPDHHLKVFRKIPEFLDFSWRQDIFLSNDLAIAGFLDKQIDVVKHQRAHDPVEMLVVSVLHSFEQYCYV